ncbi:MAG TPA: alpha/beta hydrolase [Telluria sp.]|nr:alpha/beta hydrolase [Telluria sp.]
MSHFSEISYSSSDGLSLYARDYHAHSGPARLPVICIHGLTRNSADFDELAPEIARMGRRVIAVDVRGRGHSDYDRNPEHYNPVVYADDVAKLAHDLGIARAVFIGTSMGGLVTMTMAVRHPKLVAASILNDTGPRLSPKGLARIAGYAGKCEPLPSWEHATEAIRQINEPAFPANSADEWSKWARRAFAETEQGQLAMRYDPNIALPLATGKLKSTSLGARFAFRRLAKRRPTLLVRGALSDLIEAEQAEYMRKTAPRMLYAEVPGVGHAPMLTEPEAMTAVREFLAQVD